MHTALYYEEGQRSLIPSHEGHENYFLRTITIVIFLDYF